MARRVMSIQEMVDRKGIDHAKDQSGKAAARKRDQALALEFKAKDLRTAADQIDAELENTLRGISSKALTPAATEPAPETVVAETPAELQAAPSPAEIVG